MKYVGLGLALVGAASVLLPFTFVAFVLRQASAGRPLLSVAADVMRLQSEHRGLLLLFSVMVLGVNIAGNDTSRGELGTRLGIATGIAMLLASCLLFIGA